jgi:hypothetical protein
MKKRKKKKEKGLKQVLYGKGELSLNVFFLWELANEFKVPQGDMVFFYNFALSNRGGTWGAFWFF